MGDLSSLLYTALFEIKLTLYAVFEHLCRYVLELDKIELQC